MSECMSCHFYDRNNLRIADGRAVQWGLCRREPPRLSPVNAKAHSIEGVWPTVRDDDWCGQWQAQKRRATDTAPLAMPHAQSAPTSRPVPMTGGASAIAAGYKPTPAKRTD